MIRSAGIVFIYDHKALLLHPTNSRDDLYMPPKGQIDSGEDIYQTAIREVKEEAGIDMKLYEILADDVQLIQYENKNGNIPKTVYIIIHHIKDLSEIGLSSLEIPKSMLQIEENDHGKFMDADEIQKHCMWRYKEFILKAIM